jgi:hypothetical protein
LKGFFCLAITKLKKCHLQLKNLKRLIFVNKNWSNDSRIDCKPPSNLVELIEKNLNFEEELQKIEGSFEWDELLDI